MLKTSSPKQLKTYLSQCNIRSQGQYDPTNKPTHQKTLITKKSPTPPQREVTSKYALNRPRRPNERLTYKYKPRKK